MAERWSHVANDVVDVDEYDDDRMTLPEWLMEFDRLLKAEIGLTHRDIADRDWWELWEGEVTPAEEVAQVLEEGLDAL